MKKLFSLFVITLCVVTAQAKVTTVGITTTTSTTEKDAGTGRTIKSATNLEVTHELYSSFGETAILAEYSTGDKAMASSYYSQGAYNWKPSKVNLPTSLENVIAMWDIKLKWLMDMHTVCHNWHLV